MRILVTRPEPGASATAVRLAALGHDTLVAPLLTVEPVAWDLPSERPDAVVMTSANAARHGGDALTVLTGFRLYAVGAATAAAAQAAGFIDVTTGEGDAQAVLALAASHGVTRALHLAGEDRIDSDVPPGLTLDVATVYRAVAVALSEGAAAALAEGQIDLVLLFSPRTARIFAYGCDTAVRAGTAIAALNPAVAAAAGPGWQSVITAPEPNEAALLAAAGLTCEKPRAED